MPRAETRTSWPHRVKVRTEWSVYEGTVMVLVSAGIIVVDASGRSDWRAGRIVEPTVSIALKRATLENGKLAGVPMPFSWINTRSSYGAFK